MALKQPKQEAALTSRGTWIKLLGATLAAGVFFLVRLLPVGGMEPQVQGLLAILAAAIILWVTMPVPIYLTGILIPVVAWLTGLVDFSTAFSGYSGYTFWFLFAALGIAGCVRESGVATRIALFIIKRGKPGYGKLLILISSAMFVLGYILPLAAARAALMLAIVIPLVALFGARLNSNTGKSFVIAVTMLGAASGWQVLTGGMPAMVLWGSLGQAGYYVSWLGWALAMVVPTGLIFVGMYFVITRLFKPDNLPTSGNFDRVETEIKAIGPISPVEKRCLIIVGVILAGWLTEPLHNIGVEAVGILGVFLFVLPGIGVLEFENFMKKAIPWSLLFFVGALMSLVVMAGKTGLGVYIGDMLVGPVYSFATNPVTFVLATWILNTVVAGTMLFVPSLALFVPAITATAVSVGINPVLGALVYLSCFPQMFFWAGVPFFPLALSSGAIETRDWIKAGIFYWLLWPVVHIICFYTWYPLLVKTGVLG